MEKVEGRTRVASLVVDARPTVIVARVQDEGKTVVDLRYVELKVCQYK